MIIVIITFQPASKEKSTHTKMLDLLLLTANTKKNPLRKSLKNNHTNIPILPSKSKTNRIINIPLKKIKIDKGQN